MEYLDVTEEVWAKRVVDPGVVKKHAERYPPVLFEEMYGVVPRRLYDIRGGHLPEPREVQAEPSADCW